MRRFHPEVRALCERVRRPAEWFKVITPGSVRRVSKRIARATREFATGLRFGPGRLWRTATELELRELPQAIRQPAARGLIALALVVPAGGFLLLQGAAVSPAPEGPAPAAAQDGQADADGEGAPTLGARLESGDPAVARAWRERALSRESSADVSRFLRAYRDYRVAPDLAARIHRTALETGIDPDIAFGLVRVESSFRRSAVSWAGAVGYTQVLPSTARWIVPGTSRSDLFDTDKNLHVGFTYLRYLLDTYDGNVRLALTAYNRGPGTVNRLLRQGRNPDNGYAGKVLSRRG